MPTTVGKRQRHTKTKTGCVTCKIRRVKCDENKPHCFRCIRFGHTCDGYSKDPPKRQQTRALLPVAEQSGNLVIYAEAQNHRALIPIPKETTLYPQPAARRFRSPDEYRYFISYCDETAKHLGGYYEPVLWTRIILQTSELEPSIRHAVIAIGALQMTKSETQQPSNPNPKFKSKKAVKLTASSAESAPKRHLFALQQYSKAIHAMRKAIFSQQQDLRTTLVASILIICFELYHGNYEAAARQVRTSVHVIEEWKAKQASPSASSAIEDDLVHTFNRLDIQAMSYGDQYTLDEHFRLKEVGASTLENMPTQFANGGEASFYFNLVVRRVVHFACIVEFPRSGSHGVLTGVANNYEAMHADHQRCMAEADRWMATFRSLFDSSRDPGHKDFSAGSTMRMHFISLYTHLRYALYDNEMICDEYLDLYIEVVELAKGLLEGDNSVFSFDLHTVWPLYDVAVNCRDSKVRNEAIRLMAEKPRREGVWDSALAARLCKWIVSLEEEGLVDGFVPEEWRARNAKVKFDFNNRVVLIECEQPGKEGDMRKRQATMKL